MKMELNELVGKKVAGILQMKNSPTLLVEFYDGTLWEIHGEVRFGFDKLVELEEEDR